MGTPRRKRVFFEKIFKGPELSEKIRPLEVGKKAGKNLDLEKLADILEEVKKILLPLVEKFNKPLATEVEFTNNPLTSEFKKIRGVRLYVSSFLDIWLERSGLWFLRTWDASGQRILQRVVSSRLAVIIVEKCYDFLRNEFRDPEFLEEFPCLKKVAYYVESCLGFLFRLNLNKKKPKQENLNKKPKLFCLSSLSRSIPPQRDAAK